MEEHQLFNFDSVIHQTNQAVAFDIGEKTDTDEIKPLWIPKTVINLDTFDPDEGECLIKTWWLIDNGLV